MLIPTFSVREAFDITFSYDDAGHLLKKTKKTRVNIVCILLERDSTSSTLLTKQIQKNRPQI